jgi:hypothetical protein
MPPPVALPAPEPGLKRADFGLPGDNFIFYFSFDFRSYTSRKNPRAAIAAFRRTFPHSDAPVCLVLKGLSYVSHPCAVAQATPDTSPQPASTPHDPRRARPGEVRFALDSPVEGAVYCEPVSGDVHVGGQPVEPPTRG